MRMLVTGGTGLVGSNLARELARQGHEVIITGSNASQKFPDFKGKVIHTGFCGIDWDSLGKIDVLFHQAAINDTTMTDEREIMRANVDGSKMLFEHVVKHGCKRIVYASSTAIYGHAPAPQKETSRLEPLNPYAKSKIELEQFAATFQKKHPAVIIIGLRYCNVYGPGENHKGKRATMIYQLAQQMQQGNPRIFKDGEHLRDYIYVKDVVTANLLAAKATESCVVNCGSGKSYSFNRVVAILNTVLGLSRKPEYIDNPYIGKYQNHTECDMSLAKKKLGVYENGTRIN